MAQAKAITANPTVKAVLEYLNTKSSSSVPTGAICFFATTAIPTGWLLCNGSNVSRTEYAALFAAIGTKFGAGDGKTTFTLPNLDERFIEGTTDTAKVGQYLEAGLPNITNHYHAFGYHNDNNQGRFISSRETSTYLLPVGFGTRYWNGKDGGSDFQESSTYEANLVTSEAVFGDTHQIVQPSSCRVLPCIKV